MSLLTVNNVQISGIVSAVPKTSVDIKSLSLFSSIEESNKFSSVTGIKHKRHSKKNQCTSDICYEACLELIKDLNWKKEDVEILIMITQTPDYLVPNTSIILQDRLGLSKDCVCFDVPLGCSGYVYGLSIISKFLQNGNLQKGILVVGDTLSKQCSNKDKSTYPLFGDAGCATALEYKPEASDMQFNLWSDGSGYNTIIVPDGGYRNPINSNSLLDEKDANGNVKNKTNTHMNGAEVFSFGISEVPNEIKKFASHFNVNLEEIDFAFFHQANKFMNEMIRKKLGLTKAQVPYSLEEYGNTSSATIPLTMSKLKNDINNKKIILCGFGVGLSIGIMYTELKEELINKIIEV